MIWQDRLKWKKKNTIYIACKFNIAGATPIAQTESRLNIIRATPIAQTKNYLNLKSNRTFDLESLSCHVRTNSKAYSNRCKYISSCKGQKHDEGRRGLWESGALWVLLQNLKGGVWEGDFKLNRLRSSWSAHLRTQKLFINWVGDVNPNQEYLVSWASLAGGWVYRMGLQQATCSDPAAFITSHNTFNMRGYYLSAVIENLI